MTGDSGQKWQTFVDGLLSGTSSPVITHERVMDTGFLQISMQQPHTIILNPIVGIIALAAGLCMLMMGRRTA